MEGKSVSLSVNTDFFHFKGVIISWIYNSFLPQLHAHMSSEYSTFQITEISFNSYFQICACQNVVFENFPLFIPVRQMKLPLQLSCIPLHHESYLFPCLTLDKDRNFVLVQVIIGKKNTMFLLNDILIMYNILKFLTVACIK